MLICGGMISSGRLCTRSVAGAYLDQLQRVAGEHYGTRRGGEVAADGEFARIHLRGQAAEVVDHVLDAAQHAAAAGLEKLAQRRRITEQRVGRRGGTEQQLHRDSRTHVVPPVQPAAIEPRPSRFGPSQVALLKRAEERVAAPHRIGEALVPGLRPQVGLPQSRRRQTL